MKIFKKLIAGIVSVSIVASMSAISAFAMFDDEATDDATSTSDSVLSASTFTAEVTRVSSDAILVKPDSSANLGDSLGVVCSNANSYVVGDTVEITYSSAVTEETGGFKSIKADSVKKVSSGSSSSINLLDDEEEEKKEETPVTTTTTPKTEVTASNTTPKTGNTMAGLPAFVVTGSLLAIGAGLKSRSKEDK